MSGVTKAERLNEMKRLYMQRAYSDIEIAERLGIDRTTAYRYRLELSSGENPLPIEQVERGKWKINRDHYLTNVRVNVYESLALYLAARRATQQGRLAGQHAANALEKVAVALRQPMTERLVKAAERVLAEQNNPERIKIFETVTRSWVEQVPLRIAYRALWAKKARQNVIIHPYLIEPSLWSDSVYVIAYSQTDDHIIPFKIERIEKASLSTSRFEIPADFDEETLLKHAWGIWVRQDEPQTVRLAFKAGSAAARRLRESRWHPLETVTETEDGGYLWEAPIAEWREMLPWVRGWGADVEALAPEALRKELEREVKRMARVYGVGDIKSEDNLIAHVRANGEEQSLIAHLTEASQLAEGFAAKIGLPEIGKILGLLHDFGKASEEYQHYLRSAEGLINPDEDGYVDYKAKKGKIDHSTAGAQLVWHKLEGRGREGKLLAQFLALALASHHSGLIDCLKPDGRNEFQRRIEKPDDQAHLREARQKLHVIEQQLDGILTQPVEKIFVEKVIHGIKEEGASKEVLWFKRGLMVRYLLSCLLDADRLSTADFEHPENEVIRNYGKYIPWDTLIERLEAQYAKYAQQKATMKPGQALEINHLRTQVAQSCLEAAEKPKGIYQLTVPTGGGKTEASLRFALHHARAHGMDRIFYIVPYITIIDQNADKVRGILEKAEERGKVVLEHHSNFVPEDDTRYRHNLLTENWDAPIVFTTQVQFLEALFSSGTRDARRLHQLANSVIIFDEVQTIPIKITHMFTTALRFLTHDCGSTVVLCTATQPPFENTGNPYRDLTIPKENHIIQNEVELFEKLKRVEVHDERRPGGLTNEEIADLAEQALQGKGSVLIVVNTRASAKALYVEIKHRYLGVPIYHLSTNMCPAHRIDVLEKYIKPKLKTKEPVICVSTQLIEAGVDIDFGAVIRSLAGLDSIAQSAGRCNRHGVREGLGNVWVVNPESENLSRLPDIKMGREKSQTVLDNFRNTPERYKNDRIGLRAIKEYYQYYFQMRKNEMDYPVDPSSPLGRDDELFNVLSMNKLSVDAYQRSNQTVPDILLRQSFQSANKAFYVIESLTRGVIVPYEHGKVVIAELCSAPKSDKQYQLLKKAQRYSVNLYEHQFRQLAEIGAIQEVQSGIGVYYLDEQYYSEEFGWSDKPVNAMTTTIV